VDVITFDLLQGIYSGLLAEKCEKKVNVGLVGLDGIYRKTFFGDKVVEKKLSCRNELLREG
jgi:hypothetical protein